MHKHTFVLGNALSATQLLRANPSLTFDLQIVSQNLLTENVEIISKMRIVPPWRHQFNDLNKLLYICNNRLCMTLVAKDSNS